MITKEKVQTFENVRQSGVTNMFDVRTVGRLTSLTKDECLDIIKHYTEYIKKFDIKRR